jgi:hypothetical protein
MRVRKVAFPAVMLGVSLYILLPTADEIVINPVLGLFFSLALHIPFVNGALLSIVVYRAIGITCLLGALITGGKPIYNKLKARFTKKETQKQQPEANFSHPIVDKV